MSIRRNKVTDGSFKTGFDNLMAKGIHLGSMLRSYTRFLHKP